MTVIYLIVAYTVGLVVLIKTVSKERLSDGEALFVGGLFCLSPVLLLAAVPVFLLAWIGGKIK